MACEGIEIEYGASMQLASAVKSLKAALEGGEGGA